MILRNRELFDLLGEDGLVALSARWGGISIDVPQRTRGDAWAALEQTLGERRAALLVDRYGGDRIEVPRLCMRAIWHRNAKIYRQRLEGRSNAELARENHLTKRWVRIICNEFQPAEQLCLF